MTIEVGQIWRLDRWPYSGTPEDRGLLWWRDRVGGKFMIQALSGTNKDIWNIRWFDGHPGIVFPHEIYDFCTLLEDRDPTCDD